MADMKVEEEERRAKGLPTERERFRDSDDEDIVEDEEEQDSGEDAPRMGYDEEGRWVDITRARRIRDPNMEADGSKWPRPA